MVASAGGVAVRGLAVSMRSAVVSVGPALAKLAPLHLLTINHLFIDRMAIKLGNGLCIRARWHRARIAGFAGLVSTGLVSTVVAAIPSTIAVVLPLVASSPVAVSSGSMVLASRSTISLVSTVRGARGSW